MDKIKLELIKNAIRGDKISLEKLIKQEQKNVYAMLFYLKKDESDISDIMQNILIKLASRISQLKNPLSYKNWLNQLIIRSYYDYLRKNQRKAKIHHNQDEKSLFDIPDETFNPQNSILNNEVDIIVKKSIQNLPNHYKIPLALREIQGLSYNEISNITKTSIGTVKSRISRGRSIIQSDLEKYEKS